MSALKLRWEGMGRLGRKLQAAKLRLPEAAGGALFVEGEKLMSKAKRLTPVDEGVLRASGHVQLPEVQGTVVAVELGFGGPAGSGEGQEKDVGYAVHVHENLTARHTVGQAKYLEDPLRELDGRTLGRRLARAIRGRLLRR